MIRNGTVRHAEFAPSDSVRWIRPEEARIEWCPRCGSNLRPYAAFEFGNVAIVEDGTIMFDGRRLDLTRTLHSMADSLIRGRGRGLTRAILAARLDSDVFEDSIKKYVERLRACFRAIDPGFDQIEAVHGFGAYRWRFRGAGSIVPIRVI